MFKLQTKNNKLLIVFVILAVLISLMGLFFIKTDVLKEWRESPNCQYAENDYKSIFIKGSWIVKEDEVLIGRIMFIGEDSFRFTDTLSPGFTANGNWIYDSKTGILNLKFINQIEVIEPLLMKASNEVGLSDSVVWVDLESMSIKTQIHFNDSECDVRNPYFRLFEYSFIKSTN